MPDLILHIGLGKCGSSTLQRDIFQHEEGYLGTAPGLDFDLNFAKQLQQCAPFGGRQTLSKRGLRRWARRVLEFQEEQWPGIDRLILSNEVLSTANHINDRPVLRVLTQLRDRLVNGRVRAVLVLRSQTARIGSQYAQGSAINSGASQPDFEKFVARVMSNRRNCRLYDYASYVESLIQVLGRENVCVMLLEETGSIEFWKQLSHFCQLENFDPNSMIASSSDPKNKRSLSKNRWKISSFDSEKAARRQVDKWLNPFWSKRMLSSSRKKVRSHLVGGMQRRLVRSEQIQPATVRDEKIVMSPQARKLIEDQCGQFNDRLGQLLGKDLAALGYPVSSPTGSGA